MGDENLTDAEIRHFIDVGRRAARGVSADPDIYEGAANFAAAELHRLLDTVSTGKREREAWVRVVAVNDARRSGKKAHRDIPFGRAGSERPQAQAPHNAKEPTPGGSAERPPDVGELEKLDDRVRDLIAAINAQPSSLSTKVANAAAFRSRWSLLSGEVRNLLYMRYVEDLTAKQIAEALKEKEDTINKRVQRAKEAARPLLGDLVDEIGPWQRRNDRDPEQESDQ